MTEAERRRADLVEATEQNRLGVTLKRVRRQAAGDGTLHLSVSVDSGVMRLGRDGVLLRDMPVEVGGEGVVGHAPDTIRAVVPRGARTIERIVGPRDRWEVPSWPERIAGSPRRRLEARAGAGERR